ncbi:MAG: hypothetical protein H0X37_18200 [Herpetosiphonaceae bacterium]|nr:hypothetical protein [Herpetosiphonaceae bacterium]
MSKPVPEEQLAAQHYVTVIMRLLVDQRGRLVHGEIIDLQSPTQRPFNGWRGLLHALHRLIAGTE